MNETVKQTADKSCLAVAQSEADRKRDEEYEKTSRFCSEYGLICFEYYQRRRNREKSEKRHRQLKEKSVEGCDIIKFPVHTESYLRELEALILSDYKDQLRYPLTEAQEQRVRLIRDVERMTKGASKESFAIYRENAYEELDKIGRSDLRWHTDCIMDYFERKRKIERMSRIDKSAYREKGRCD